MVHDNQEIASFWLNRLSRSASEVRVRMAVAKDPVNRKGVAVRRTQHLLERRKTVRKQSPHEFLLTTGHTGQRVPDRVAHRRKEIPVDATHVQIIARDGGSRFAPAPAHMRAPKTQSTYYR